MTIATILPTGKTVFLDANDNPLAGGKVYFYIPNTTTPKTTWQDATGSVANSNPVVLDGDGSALIYGSGQYRQIVNDSLGNLVWDQLTQDTYGLVMSSNNVFTGSNTFTGPVSFVNGFAGIGNGGYINKFRNPVMDIFQRGIGITINSGTSGYTFDGWIVAATGANCAISIGGPLFPALSFQSLTLNSAAGLTDVSISQRIESYMAAELYNNGNVVTFQACVFNNSGGTIVPTLTISHPTAQDNYASVVIDFNAIPLQAIASGPNYGIISYSFTPNIGIVNGMQVQIDFGGALDSNTSHTIVIGNFDIRSTPGVVSGLNSTPPSPEIRPIGSELALCQRYYEQFTIPVWQPGTAAGTPVFWYGFKTTKRTASPTMVTVTAPTYTNTASAATFADQSADAVSLKVTVTGTNSFLSGWIISASSEL